MGFGNNGRLTDEKSPVTLENMIGDYKRSKFMAEQLVIDAGRSGQNVVMVNPTTPVGERDIKPTPERTDYSGLSAAKVSCVCRYRAESGGRSGLRRGSPVGDGEGAARRALHSWRREPHPEADSRQAGSHNRLAVAEDQAAVCCRAGDGVVDTLVVGKMLRREPRVTIDAVRMGRKKMFVTSAKAERELGWNPRPVDEALRRAVEWFRANGYV
jgi:dihydroflavonol-4-reductase